VAKVKIENDTLKIQLSLLDQLLALHGSIEMPLSHVTNAFVSDFEDLEVQYKLTGTGAGFYKMAGIFANPNGLIFCDVDGERDCLVVETRGERFPRIAITLDKDVDVNALAHEIMQMVPDSGPVD